MAGTDTTAWSSKALSAKSARAWASLGQLMVFAAIGLWILACPASLAEDDEPKALNQQVDQLIKQGKYREAIPIAEQAVEVAKRTRGQEDPETADALSNLGLLFQIMGDYAEAEPLHQEALRIRQKVLGPEHPDTAQSLNSLGELYVAMHEYAKAEPLYQEALRIRQKVLGPEHPGTRAESQRSGPAVLGYGRV